MTTLATYNLGDPAAARLVVDLRRLDTDVIGVQEAGDRTEVLSAITTHQVVRDAGEAARVALLVRLGIGVSAHGLTRISVRTKVGRLVAGARRTGYAEPKFISDVTLTDGTRIGVTHLVPSTSLPANRAARALYRRQVAGCVAWFASGGDVLMGDFNGDPDYNLLAPLRAVATPHTAPSRGTRSIDHLWTRRGAPTLTDVQALGGYSSDHRPVVGVLTPIPVPQAATPTPAPVPKPTPKEPTMAVPYLVTNPPKRRQFRARTRKPTGLLVVHTAESEPDQSGPDTGADAVARFIRDRSDPGSYHTLADSDSRLQLVPYDQAAYGDGTGSNEFGIHISAATQAAKWPTLPKAWRDGAVRQMAKAAADAARWLKKTHGIDVPARRVTKAQSDAGHAGFISHGERDPGRRTDPGKDFPWDDFLAAFREEMGQSPSKVIPPMPSAAEQAARNIETGQSIKATKRPKVRDLMRAAVAALRRGNRKP